MDFKTCKTCDQCTVQKPVIYCPRYICSIDNTEVDPYNACPLWGNDKAEEAKDNE